MLSFTENIKISINLLNYLTDKPSSSTNLAPLCETTKRMLDGVIKTLKVHNLIGCSRGRNGGIYLAKPEISLYDVCKAFYPEIAPSQLYCQPIYGCYIEFLKSIQVVGTKNLLNLENIVPKTNTIVPLNNTKEMVSPPNLTPVILPDKDVCQESSPQELFDLDGDKGW
jgi:DNA-binding IscR family transcriptional regulator